MTKQVVAAVGVRCAEGVVVSRQTIVAKGYPMPPPFVIKPTNETTASGYGLSRLAIISPMLKKITWIYGEEVLVERYIPGRELTVGLMGDRHRLRQWR